MNAFQSLISRISHLSLSSQIPSRFIGTTAVLAGDKKPKKRTAADKAAAAAATAALLAPTPGLAATAAVPVKPKKVWDGLPCKPTVPPGCEWVMDKTIPRTSVLSHQPIRSHNWQDWRMLRDVKRRAYTHIYWRQRTRMMSIYRSSLMPKEMQDQAIRDVFKIPRDANMKRIHNRCVITSRARAVLSRWRISRIMFRHFADYNQLSGVMRAKWGNRNDRIYWHDIDPPLEGTLEQYDPVSGRREWEYWRNECHYSGKPMPPQEYNYGRLKEYFQYPKPQK